jgi:hypothetical protein
VRSAPIVGVTRYAVMYATPPLPNGGGNYGCAGRGAVRRGLFNGGIIQNIRARRANRVAARLGY